MDRKKETGQKFSSGKVYKENSIDFNAFLNGDISESESVSEVVPTSEIIEKNEEVEIKKETKPDNDLKIEKKDSQNNSTKTSHYDSLLLQAMEDDDDEFDELEDGFEEEVKKLTSKSENNEKETESKTLSNLSRNEENVQKYQDERTMANNAVDKISEKEISIQEDVKQEEIVESKGYSESEKMFQQPIIEESITKTENNDSESNIQIKEEVAESNTETESIEENNENQLDMTDDEFFAEGAKSSEEKGRTVQIFELSDDIKDEDVTSATTIKRQFNPNPDPSLIEGFDFNHPCLDDIYGYTYPEEMAKLRERRAIEKQSKLEALLAEEQRKEEEKAKKEASLNVKNSKRKKKQEQIASMLPEDIKAKKQFFIPKSYPKHYEDPTDEEIDDRTGKSYYYFNFTKTVQNSKFKFLAKILPVTAIDEVLYDKDFTTIIAERQHDKSVRLNSMTAGEQFFRDIRNVFIVLAMFFALGFAINYKYKTDIVPNQQYELAMKTLNNKYYEDAYYMFTELGTKDLSKYYAKYCEAKMYQKTEQYQKAIDAFSLLSPYNDSVFKTISVNIEDEINECHYQIGLSLYYEGNFEEARKVFKNIYEYSDAIEKYYECGYRIAKEIYENSQTNEDSMNALVYFYKIRKYANTEVQNTISIISDTLYSNANKLYEKKEYSEALELFKFLAKYNYENTNESEIITAKSMVKQCTYKYGLDLYKNKEYEKAIEVLAEIPEYKDSAVLRKECIYNIALKQYKESPIASIETFDSIEGYKDATDYLNSDKIVLYGKWEITDTNGSSSTIVNFNFYEDGRFVTNTQIDNVAISKKDNPIYYTWNGDAFVTNTGIYSIEIEDYDEEKQTLTLICKNTMTLKTTKYGCRNLASLNDMLLAEKEEEISTEGIIMLHKQYSNLLRTFMDKKSDHLILVNGSEVNIFKGKID